MPLKLVDIDDRLIHGQLASTWIPDNGIESVIIVDDKVANDPVQKSVASPRSRSPSSASTSSSTSSRRPSSRR